MTEKLRHDWVCLGQAAGEDVDTYRCKHCLHEIKAGVFRVPSEAEVGECIPYHARWDLDVKYVMGKRSQRIAIGCRR